MPSTEQAIERISERIQTLSDLHSRGIVQGKLFRKQIQALLNSRDARKIFQSKVEPDRKAIKILNRLEDPSGWRELSMKSREHREESFYRIIEEIISDSDQGFEKLIRILQLGCLPFFSGFLAFSGKEKEPPKETRPSRVSVLD